MKIYVVLLNEGEYSDRETSVAAAFTTRDAAREYVKRESKLYRQAFIQQCEHNTKNTQLRERICHDYNQAYNTNYYHWSADCPDDLREVLNAIPGYRDEFEEHFYYEIKEVGLQDFTTTTTLLSK